MPLRRFDSTTLNDRELQEVRHAFDETCAELGIGLKEATAREEVAKLMFALVMDGERDREVIKTRTIRMLRTLVDD